MSGEEDVFLKYMKGVSPIKKNNRIEKEKPKIIKNIIRKKNTTNKTEETKSADNKIIKNTTLKLEELNIKKNIKKRVFTIEKKIDFHGKTLLESEELFTKTILNCYDKGFRCLLFVTGKGVFKKKDFDDINKPKLYRGVIRSGFTNWVKSSKFSKQILSFEPASIEHGGDGAFYVYLRKKKY